MKYYETSYEDYIQSVEKYNLHPYIEKHFSSMKELCNIIFYGASGIGKYSQVLNFLKSYSPSNLKYDKRITISTEKQNWTTLPEFYRQIDDKRNKCEKDEEKMQLLNEYDEFAQSIGKKYETA